MGAILLAWSLASGLLYACDKVPLASDHSELAVVILDIRDAGASEATFIAEVRTIELTQVDIPYVVSVEVDGKVTDSAQVLLTSEGFPDDPSQGYLSATGYLEVDGRRVSTARGTRHVLVGHTARVPLLAYGDGVRKMFRILKGYETRAMAQADAVFLDLRKTKQDQGLKSDPAKLQEAVARLEEKVASHREDAVKWRRWQLGKTGESDQVDEFVRQFVTLKISPKEPELVSEAVDIPSRDEAAKPRGLR